MNYRDPQTRAALAAEYVLGTLQGRARQRFEKLMAADFALRREVERWQDDLYPTLVEALPQRKPSKRVWRKIARQIKPEKAKKPGKSFWDSLDFWRIWGSIASTAMLVLVLYVALDLGRQLPITPPTLNFVTIINDADNRPAWLVQIDHHTGQLAVQTLQAQSLAADRSFELWLLPGADQPPQSLGLIQAQGLVALTLTPDVQAGLPNAAGLAVSLEPAGGSPTGLPTGPVLYQGALTPPA